MPDPFILRHSYEVSEVRVLGRDGTRITNVIVWRHTWKVPPDVATVDQLRRIIDARGTADYVMLLGAYRSEAAANTAMAEDALALRRS